MNFRNRLLLIMLGLSLIPLLILGIVTLTSINGIGSETSDQVSIIATRSVDASTNALNQLGEEIIKQKSQDVARQISLYLQNHPRDTISDLQNDKTFQELAVQGVGETGYTTILDKDSLYFRFHPNEKIVDTEASALKDTLPELYAITEKIPYTEEVGGYYDWIEADGSIRAKYMYITSAQIKTADGVTPVIAATTYMDEFSAPAQELEAIIVKENTNLIETITSSISQTLFLIIIIIIITIIAVSGIGFIFARNVTGPLNKTVTMIQEMARGHLSMRLSLVRDDEIGILSSEMDRFADYLQHEVIRMMQRIAEGEQVSDIMVVDEKDEIGPAMIKMVDTIDNLINETGTLTNRAASGDLSVKGDVSSFHGRYCEIIEGFNQTLETLIGPLLEAIRLSGRYAEADFTERFSDSVSVSGDLIPFREALNKIGLRSSQAMNEVKKQVESLVASMEETNASLEGISAGSQELAHSSGKVSELSEKSSNNIHQILQTMEDLSTTVTNIAQSTNEVSVLASRTNEISDKGAILAGTTEERMEGVARSVNETNVVIKEIAQQMDEIIKIIDIISEISEQTNLLALNAAIEAARAGEAGLGFAVVAGEVKSLAQESQRSAEHISSIIYNLQNKTDQIRIIVEKSANEAEIGNKAVNETISVFQEIAGLVADIAKNMEGIASSSEEEAASVEEITASISEMESFSKETEDIAVSVSAASEETSASLDQISTAVNDVSKSIYVISEAMNKFKTN